MVESVSALKCPSCESSRIWKDGIRRTAYGDVQRCLCPSCGLRFSESTQSQVKLNILSELTETPKPKHDLCNIKPGDTLSSKQSLDNSSLTLSENVASHGLTSSMPTVEKVLSTFYPNSRNSRVGASHKGAKNLAETKPLKERLAGATAKADVKGKVLEYLWHLKKKGLKESTVKHYGEKLNQLITLDVNLLQPEEIKVFLATNSRWSDRTKAIVVAICDGFLNWLKIRWEPPKYKPAKKLPFIPREGEVDQLIARAGKRLAPFLQLLKETGMRRGEAVRLKWTDIDFKRKTVSVTPEKGSNPRLLPLSEKTLGMLQTIPKKSDRMFPTLSSLTSNFYLQRKTLARKLNDPRILKISLHTLRHWKATMEYHKTKDIIHVQQVLGHRDIKSTMIYINLEQALFNISNDEFHVKTAKTVEEACKLAETGFEYFDTIDTIHIYRKRK